MLCDFGSLSVQTFYILRDVNEGWPQPLLTYKVDDRMLFLFSDYDIIVL